MAGTKIMVTSMLIRSRIWDAEKYRRAFRRALEQEAQIMENMYMLVGKGFTDQPTFEKEIKVGVRGSFSATVKTDSVPFIYIDQGTHERWAVMSDDFRPRTTKRTLGIKGQQGKAVIRGKSAMLSRGISVRPGIEPREYSDEIAKRREKKFPALVQKELNKVAR